MSALRRYLAARRLAKMVEAKRNSPETKEFIRRRKAALRHEPKVWA